MILNEIKKNVCDTIDNYRSEIINCGRYILNNPELGYREYKTSEYFRNKLNELNISYEYPLGITGVKGVIRGKESKINVCIIGELDAVKSPEHPNADHITEAAHACGHNVQIAVLLGVAYGLIKSDCMKDLFGDVILFAVPSEEFIEVEQKLEMIKNKTINYIGGKQQLIHEGAFDDIDMAIMVHAQPNTPEMKVFTRGGSLGFIAENIRFIGKEAHGAEPFDGINALNAAMLALMGIHANRETFSENDKIRIHPIITKGGDLVNTIPADVKIETYIRGANIEAINKGKAVVNRVVKGAAEMIGAEVDIQEIKGYLPLIQNEELTNLFESNAAIFIDGNNITKDVDMIGSTDIGDLSHLIPCIQPTIGGFSGAAHSKDFLIENEEFVYITSSKLIATTIIDLLYNNAEKAISIKKNFSSQLSKKDYLNNMKCRKGI